MASDDECYDYYDEDEGLVADEDDLGLPDEEAVPLRELRADHWAITRKALSAAQQQDLSMVMNLVSLEPHNARALLMHHQWKMGRIHDFLERRGREGLFREAGIVVPPEDNSTASPFRAAADMVSHKRPRIATCNVCFEDVSQLSDVSTMDCGHCFCNDCWTEHFLASLNNGRKHIHCMEVKCPAICNDATVRRLLGRKYPDAAKRFDGFVLESYLENNASVKWCPSAPHCGRAIRVDASDASERYCEVECPCGVSFCFNCAAPAHSPVPCSMWDQWDAKFRGDSENLKWISLHTKSCPGCHKPIEKNGGCNHVACRCGVHLCYACGGRLDSTHNCNRYDENKAARHDAIRRQMLRYTHYCDRFNVHLNSRTAEQGDLWSAIQKRILQLESASLVRPLIRQASWLANAHRSLLASRLVLSRSYAFAYYMFGDEVQTYPSDRANLATAKELFEDQQEQLERNAERLSKVLATEAPPVLVEDEVLRTMGETVNLSRIVDTHCREMYKCIQDELLPLLVETTHIAPYRPDGPDKAKELPAGQI